ncbi:MAG: hypothetical protein RR281_03340, partial [Pseudoflavonifractor sp.]
MENDGYNGQDAALLVCVDGVEDGRIFGRVCSGRLTKSLAFSDPALLLLQLDGVLDRQNFPQAFQRIRSFTGRKGETLAALCPAEGMTPEAVAAADGALGSFRLCVFSRRHATWQGSLDWL